MGAEQAAIELYKKTRAQLVNHLADLKADEQTLRNHLDEMNNCVHQEGQVQASATKEELRVLAELRGIVEKRYAQFSKGAAHRADVDEFNAGGAASAEFERNEELERFL